MSNEPAPEGPFPRFSNDAMAARRRALTDVAAARGVEHVVLYGADRSGSAVGWITRWPVTREAAVVLHPGERDALLVQFYNHVPNAERIADACDVAWGGPSTIASAAAELERRGARNKRVGVVGPLPFAGHRAIAALASEVVDLNDDYTRLRLIKSPEEIAWIRYGAELTDAAAAALKTQAHPGDDERRLADIVERAYVARGGVTHIHYFGVTAMEEPSLAVPAQYPSRRALRAGDVLTCELSASFWDHPGQLLRTFTVGREPTDLYRRLHAAADAAFDAIFAAVGPGASAARLVEASRVIEDEGFTTRDDLVHGFVGGYLPPVLGSASRALEPVPDFQLHAGMTIVIQPNVVTRDETAGVQTGELVLVTETGAERLHNFERGLLAIP